MMSSPTKSARPLAGSLLTSLSFACADLMAVWTLWPFLLDLILEAAPYSSVNILVISAI